MTHISRFYWADNTTTELKIPQFYVIYTRKPNFGIKVAIATFIRQCLTVQKVTFVTIKIKNEIISDLIQL